MIRAHHIVHIPRRFVVSEWGGSETFVAEVSTRLVKNNHSVQIYTSKALDSREEDSYKGVRIRRFSYFYPYLGLKAGVKDQLDKKAGNLFSFSLMRALLGKKELDLIHLHTGKRMGGIARYCAKKRGIPYVISLHGGNLAVPEDERETWVEPTKGKLEWGKLLGYWVGSREVLADASAIICVGMDEYTAMTARYPDKYIEYLPNGVDLGRFAQGDGKAFRAEHSIPQGRFVCLTMARFDVQKNQVGLVRQLPSLLAKNPEIHFLLIGPVTNRAYRDQVEREAKELQVADHLTIIEGLPYNGPALVDAYHAADCFVLPSLHEPFGMVVLEAWASSLPVAVSRRGGLAALIQEGETGLFFDPELGPHEEGGIASVLKRVAGDPGLQASLGRAGHENAVASYSWDIITGRLEEIYERVYEHSLH
ncbi:MAG: glycosyltransferase family 4 protein [Sphaerochaeta sp.]|nr:glycosyltransferase family 4 protein [Sphaerochaeta sp.]